MQHYDQHHHPMGAPYPTYSMRDVQNKCMNCSHVYVGASVEACPKCAPNLPRDHQAMGLPEFLAQAKPMMDAVDAAFDSMFRRPANLSLPHERVTLGSTEYCVAGRYQPAEPQNNIREAEFTADAIWDANDPNAQDLIEGLTDGMIEILETLALVAHEDRQLEARLDAAEHYAELQREKGLEARR